VRPYRVLGLLIATASALLIMPAAAHAEPYPAEPPAATISDGTVSDGGAVTFSGAGFLPGETISISISYGGSDSTAAFDAKPGRFVLAVATLPRLAAMNVTASEDGTFSVQLTLTQVGTATLVATGLTSGVSVTQTVEVVAGSDGDSALGGDSRNDSADTSAGGGSTLPTTGPSGRGLAIGLYGGLGTILVGAGVLWFTRARRRRPTE
jgi:hypothetical protein